MEHVVIHVILYPIFYWIGFGVVWASTRGTANLLPYSDLGQSDDAVWYELRVRRDGFKYWLPESLVMVGGLTVLGVVLGGVAICYW